MADAEWPADCLDTERRFGHRAARLYPLIGRTVFVRGRRAVLLQVFGNDAVVDPEPETRAMEDLVEDEGLGRPKARRVLHVRIEAIRPCGDDGKQREA